MTLEQINSAMGSLGLSHPPTDWVPITLDDDTDLPYVARALMNLSLDTDYEVVVRTVGGGTEDRTVVIPAGHILPGLFTRVLETGTTADAELNGAV